MRPDVLGSELVPASQPVAHLVDVHSPPKQRRDNRVLGNPATRRAAARLGACRLPQREHDTSNVHVARSHKTAPFSDSTGVTANLR